MSTPLATSSGATPPGTGPSAVPLSRRGQGAPFWVMELLKAAGERALLGDDVISLCVGQPATGAPRAVIEAAHRALDSGPLGYTEAQGSLDLRRAIAAHFRDWYAVDADPARIAVTTGSSAAFTAVFLACFDIGDTVVVTRPGYPAYRNVLATLGCDVVELDCGEEVRFQPTAAQLDGLLARGVAPKGLVIASPANPTGTVIEPAELQRIAAWCDAHGCLLVSDEIYHGITFDDSPAVASAASFSPNAVVVGSFSKYFSMTGWRLGWVLLPEALVRPVELLLGNLNLCPPAVSQAGAPAAFSPEARAELRGHVDHYARNRDLLLRRLPDLGVTRFAPPDGAFYAWLDMSHAVSGHGDDTLAWSLDLLDATGVAVAPGVDFAAPLPGAMDPAGETAPRPGADPLDGRRHVRVSLCGDAARLDEALTRMARFIG